MMGGLRDNMVSMLDFREEGLGFNAWPGHEDCTMRQDILHMCPSPLGGTNGYC